MGSTSWATVCKQDFYSQLCLDACTLERNTRTNLFWHWCATWVCNSGICFTMGAGSRLMARCNTSMSLPWPLRVIGLPYQSWVGYPGIMEETPKAKKKAQASVICAEEVWLMGLIGMIPLTRTWRQCTRMFQFHGPKNLTWLWIFQWTLSPKRSSFGSMSSIHATKGSWQIWQRILLRLS